MVLEADSVSVVYGLKPVLRGVYLELSGGERVGMVGLNGSGKSTLIRALAGFDRRCSGTVRIDGACCPPEQRWKHIAVLPQESFLPETLRVRRAALLCAGSDGVSELEGHERTAGLLDRRVRALSGGERRFVEFLLVLALQRPFVLLDEPFSQIEPLFTGLMFRRIKSSPSTGFLITDHSYRDVRQIATQIVSLAGGRLSTIGSSDAELRAAGYLPKDLSPPDST